MDGKVFLLVCAMFVQGGSCYTQSFAMNDYCNDDELSMILRSVYQLELTLDDYGYRYGRNCTMEVESWYRLPRLMFYFQYFDLDCSDGYIELYDRSMETDLGRHVSGVSHQLCGQSSPTIDSVLTTESMSLYIRYVPITDTPKYDIFSLIVTAYDNEPCVSYDYKCSNGRCIDDSVQCNGYNSCGDHSGCKLSTGVIVGIVLGSLELLVLIISGIVLIFCCIRSNKRRQTMRSPGQVLYANTGAQPGQPTVNLGVNSISQNGPVPYSNPSFTPTAGYPTQGNTAPYS